MYRTKNSVCISCAGVGTGTLGLAGTSEPIPVDGGEAALPNRDGFPARAGKPKDPEAGDGEVTGAGGRGPENKPPVPTAGVDALGFDVDGWGVDGRGDF